MSYTKLFSNPKNRTRLWLIYISLLFFWGLQGYAYLGKTYSKGEMFAQIIEGKPYVSDFINSYAAARLARQCLQIKLSGSPQEMPRIYDAAVQARLQNELIAPVKPESPFYNQYAPVMYLLFLPLSLFSMPHAWLVWCFGTASTILFILCKTVLPHYQNLKTKISIPIATFASFPYWMSFKLGQTSLFLLPDMLLFWHWLSGGRHFIAGLCASLVILKLQYLPAIMAIGLALGRFKFLAGFGSGAIFLATACTLLLGVQNILDFPGALLQGETGHSVTGVAPEMMQNLRGSLFLLTGQDAKIEHQIAFAVWLTTAILIYFLFKSEKNSSPDKRNLIFATSLCLMLVSSPHCHMQDYVLLVYALELIYRTSQNIKTAWLVPSLALVLAFPILSWPFFMLMMVFHFLKLQPFFIYALITLGTLKGLMNSLEKALGQKTKENLEKSPHENHHEDA
ncbi:MAG: DUF2029 domain-containing protein [Candidatus Obscuribacterales bacterium]|nr:DUF2029 domain-containing protein [Candidatus Obscuribacterales bacterium]